MPIKFRCNYCRQFLGISRAQAGGVVDCPTCGRSIRVPLLDGSLQPMPVPALNREDSQLTRALDELARFADAPVQNLVPARSAILSDSDEAEPENLIPQPLPEPIPIEVPLPPTPVIVAPPINASLDSSSEDAVLGDHSLLAELAALSQGTLDESVETEVPSISTKEVVRKPEMSRSLMSVMAAILFFAGMLTGRLIKVFDGVPRPSDGTPNRARQQPAVSFENELTGRITLKTKEGECQPDRGARILVFPSQPPGGAKISVLGLRPGDLEADQKVADAAIKAVGGAAATADQRGNYHIPVDAGSYRVLILSHFQLREAPTVDPAVTKFLSEYLDRPDELLGRLEYLFAPLRIKGAGDLCDHSF